MKKDKDWLSEQVGELNSTNAIFNESGVSYIDTAVSIERVFDLIYQLDEPEVLSQELPAIPKYVADWIEKQKEVESNLWHVMNNVSIQRNDNPQLWTWIWRDDNMDKFAKAWLDGFTVAEEQKYYVSERDEEYGGFWFLSKNNNGDISIGVNRDWSEVDWDRLKLTEQEIKDYDEHYFAFAVPVKEGE